MYSNKKRVASVKQFSKSNGSGGVVDKELYFSSTENSLTRLRQSSWKDNNLPLEDVTEHLKRCKEACNSVKKRLNSHDKDRLTLSSGLSKKYFVGAGRSQIKHKKTDTNKKKSKYSNMKMLYQNAVYKSLNLNLSPSNSSARSGTNSRDISLRSRENSSASKNISTSSRIIEQANNNFKFHVQNNTLSSERKFRGMQNNKDLLRDNSESNGISKGIIGVSQERKSALTQQFYSPSDSRKLLKYKQKTDQSSDKKKFTVGGKTHRGKPNENLYLSYRRSSKSNLRNPKSSASTKNIKDGNSIEGDEV